MSDVSEPSVGRPAPLSGRPGVRAILVSAALAALAALASLALWEALRSYERQKIARTAEAVAEGLGHQLDARFESMIESARAFVAFWARHDSPAESVWRDDAALYARNSGFEAIAWVVPGREAPWIGRSEDGVETEPAESASGVLREAIGRARREGAESALGPWRLVGSGSGHGIWLVFPVAGGERGAMLAVLSLERALEIPLERRAKGFAVTLRSGHEEIYRSGAPAPGFTPAAFSATLANEIAWQGSVAPTPELLARETTPLPVIVLVAGLLIALLLGGVAWLAQLTRARAAALAEANRELSGLVVVARSAEAGLRKLNQELEARVELRTADLRELVRELEAFNYSVSHDLRSPLGAVVNFAGILQEDFGERLDAQGRDYLGRISTCTRSALTLMDGLLRFSRLGREELRRSRVDVQALVAELVGELVDERARSGVRIEVGDLPPASADPEMLRIVLSNLLSNALKFSAGRESPRVEVSASQRGAHTAYHVTDNGVGFDARHAHRLFSVFERLHPKDQFEGSGVGLATAARIVRRHGGSIWAEGAPGEGACFHFTLSGLDEKDP